MLASEDKENVGQQSSYQTPATLRKGASYRSSGILAVEEGNILKPLRQQPHCNDGSNTQFGRDSVQSADPDAGYVTFTDFHLGHHMQQRERALKAVLNLVLDEKRENSETMDRDMLSHRVAIQTAALLWRIFTKDATLRSQMIAIEARIDSGRLNAGNAMLQLADVRLQTLVVKTLTCYHPFWLKLGLELVLGQPVKLPDTRQLQHLEAVIRKHLFKFASAKRKVASHDQERWVHHKNNFLKRILLLVAVLDRAALDCNRVDGVPLLFTTNAAHKSSKEVLTAILKNLVCGGASPTTELAARGYTVHYVQDPRDEYDFHVYNLAVDLRNGLRLCKLAQTLTGQHDLLRQARFPADARMPRLHNINLAIKALHLRGLQTEANATHLVEGSQVQTLDFTWNVLIQLQLPNILKMRAVRAETQRIGTPSTLSLGESAASISSKLVPSTARFAADCLDQLVHWVAAIANSHSRPLTDFSESFADGSLFCYLVCFYLPFLIPKEAIKVAQFKQDAILSLQGNRRFEALVESNAPDIFRQAVVHNLGMLQLVASKIGGIPDMLSVEDFSCEHGPDERVVLLYTSFLCARLLDISREERAAHVIQGAWRKHRSHQPGCIRLRLWRWKTSAKLIQRKWKVYIANKRDWAAIKIQTAFRRHACRQQLKRSISSAVRIQSAFRRLMACHKAALLRKEKQRLLAAVYIQRRLRGHLVRNEIRHRQQAATIIQAHWRGFRCRSTFFRARAAAVAIQKCVRMNLARQHWLTVRRAANVVQVAFRAYLLRREQQRREKAATMIQKHYRRTIAAQQLKLLKLERLKNLSACCIQKVYRASRARRHFLMQRHAAITIQSAFRRAMARSRFLPMLIAARLAKAEALRQSAATRIQSFWRRFAHQQQLKLWHHAARRIQTRWRGWVVRRRLREQSEAAVRLQAFYRGFQARKLSEQRRAAALRIQACIRGYTARRYYRKLKAAIIIQKHVRRFLVQRTVQAQISAAVVIQARVRCWISVTRFRSLKSATIDIQTNVRFRLAHRKYRKMRNAAITIQSCFRGFRQRLAMTRLNQAAVLIQSHWKGLRQRELYGRLKWERRADAAATCIQKHARRYLCRASFQQSMQATVCIQSHMRRVLACRRMQKRRALRENTIKMLKECAKSMLEFTRRTQAAVRLQRVWRGYKARKLYSKMLSAHLAALEQKRAEERRALGIISCYASLFRDRSHFLHVRKAVPLIQRAWRDVYARRTKHAVLIQACFRGMLARMSYRRYTTATITIQSRWRGFIARKTAGKKVKEARSRIKRAGLASRRNPERTLLALTDRRLHTLLTSRNVSQRLDAMADLGSYSYWSVACAGVVVGTADAVSKALETMQAGSASTSASHSESYRFFTSIVGMGSTAELLFGSEFISMLTHVLQAQKNEEASFSAVGELLLRICKDGDGRLSLASNEAAVKHISSVRTILRRKESNERRYLERLQGQKGSDKSAKEATLRMLSAGTSATLLEDILGRIDASWQLSANPDVTRRLSLHPGQLRPRNTLVKEALKSRHYKKSVT